MRKVDDAAARMPRRRKGLGPLPLGRGGDGFGGGAVVMMVCDCEDDEAGQHSLVNVTAGDYELVIWRRASCNEVT